MKIPDWFVGSAVVRGVDVPYANDPLVFCPPSKKDSFTLVTEESAFKDEGLCSYIGFYQVADNRLRGPIADIHLSDRQVEILISSLVKSIPVLSKEFLTDLMMTLKVKRGNAK